MRYRRTHDRGSEIRLPLPAQYLCKRFLTPILGALRIEGLCRLLCRLLFKFFQRRWLVETKRRRERSRQHCYTPISAGEEWSKSTES